MDGFSIDKAAAGASLLRVTLLGTGGPELSADRAGAATLVRYGGAALLIDAGRNVLQRLYECGIDPASVVDILFTHLHSDHVVGLPDLWITPWFLLGRKTPLRLHGPTGLGTLASGMRQFLDFDVRRRPEPHIPAASLDLGVTEFDGPGLVWQGAGMSVRAVSVDHADGNPAYGFVIDAGGRRAVISGDCTFSEALCEAGAGADVVIHNVFAPSPETIERKPHLRSVAAKLATPEHAAEVFRRTGARHGIYTHVIRVDSTLQDIVDRTRRGGYAGELTIGEDRMSIDIGAEIVIHRPRDPGDLAELDGRQAAF